MTNWQPIETAPKDSSPMTPEQYAQQFLAFLWELDEIGDPSGQIEAELVRLFRDAKRLNVDFDRTRGVIIVSSGSRL